MIIAVTGLALSGKTSLAEKLGLELGIQTRHCGNIVRNRTRSLSLSSPNLLSDAEHQLIDSQTVEYCRSEALSLVEGTFLRHVLDDLTDIHFVSLRCDFEIRQHRLVQRTGRATPSIKEHDRMDRALCERLYGQMTLHHDTLLEIDTGKHALEECVAEVIGAIR